MYAPRPAAETLRWRNLAIIVATVLSGLLPVVVQADSGAQGDACTMLRNAPQFFSPLIDRGRLAAQKREIRACLAVMPTAHPGAWRILQTRDPRIFRPAATSELQVDGVTTADILAALDAAAGQRSRAGTERPLIPVLIILLGMSFLVFLYFLPSLVALSRGHENRVAIFALNLLAGWTFIGWVAALVWALTVNRGRTRAGETA
jgi:Superinfection immunity protein